MTPRKKAEETALVPAEPHSEQGLRRRDKDGLMLIQKHFLVDLMELGSWRKACLKLDIKERRVREWLANDHAFQEAYDAQFGREELAAIRKEIQFLAGEATNVYTEALEAERGLRKEVTCPECEHKFTVEGARPDWRMRKSAADAVMRINKILQETKSINVKGGITHTHLTGDEHMALLRLDAGLPLPEAVMARLREKGLIP